jgi:hypothetical protein
MAPVCVAIPDIVDQVHDTGERAEHCERAEGQRDGVWIEQLLAEDQPREDQDVLGPLPGTKRANEATNSS